MPTVIAQTVEHVIPTGVATNEGNSEIEMQPATVETRIRKCSKNFKYLHIYL